MNSSNELESNFERCLLMLEELKGILKMPGSCSFAEAAGSIKSSMVKKKGKK